MNLLIATTKKDFAFNRLKEEAKKKNFSVEKILYKEIKTRPKPNFFKKFDFCILRDPWNTGIDYSKYLFYIKDFFNKNSLLDFNTLDKFPRYEDKLFQNIFFSKHKIKMVQFSHFSNLKGLDTLKFPLIIKKRISSRGKAVFLVESKPFAKEFFKEHIKDKPLKDYIFEEYIPLEKDYRIMIINNKLIGSVLRKINIHAGKLKRVGVKVGVKINAPDEIKKMALKIAKLIECDFAGIDIFIGKDKKTHFGECNISPQFVSFEKNTKINVAGILMDFIKEKVS